MQKTEVVPEDDDRCCWCPVPLADHPWSNPLMTCFGRSMKLVQSQEALTAMQRMQETVGDPPAEVVLAALRLAGKHRDYQTKNELADAQLLTPREAAQFAMAERHAHMMVGCSHCPENDHRHEHTGLCRGTCPCPCHNMHLDPALDPDA